VKQLEKLGLLDIRGERGSYQVYAKANPEYKMEHSWLPVAVRGNVFVEGNDVISPMELLGRYSYYWTAEKLVNQPIPIGKAAEQNARPTDSSVAQNDEVSPDDNPAPDVIREITTPPVDALDEWAENLPPSTRTEPRQ
jgi:hypothetical protein